MVKTSQNSPKPAPYIYIWCRDKECENKALEVFASARFQRIPTDDAAVLMFANTENKDIADLIAESFNTVEQRRIKALLSQNERPCLSDFARVTTLESIERELSSRWILELLSEHRLQSLMQPIVEAGGTKVYGYEFLLRGISRDGHEIPAPAMLKAGGDAGALYLLDLAAGECAVATARRHDVQEKLFINVLPSTLAVADGLEAWFESSRMHQQLSEKQVVFELVEHEQFANISAMADVVKRLHDLGLEIALDDFGTGFNNLSTLTTVRPDYIKLDKSLVCDLGKDAHRWNMVANIIDAAKQVDVKVIAEGVEDEETAKALLDIGADFMQGYYFGYPQPDPQGLDAQNRWRATA